MSGFIQTQEKPRPCSGFFTIDVGSGAVASPGVGNKIIAQAEGDDVRYRMDGTAPTSSVGALLLENQSVELCAENLGDIKFIGTTTGGTVNIHVFK